MEKNKNLAVEIIAKWNKNPSAYGVYDIIGGLEAIGTKEAFDLRDYIINNEEYDVKDIVQMVNNLKFT